MVITTSNIDRGNNLKSDDNIDIGQTIRYPIIWPIFLFNK